ncbi:unnamed protein product, partial [Mesorhabditis spiculigera]
MSVFGLLFISLSLTLVLADDADTRRCYACQWAPMFAGKDCKNPGPDTATCAGKICVTTKIQLGAINATARGCAEENDMARWVRMHPGCMSFSDQKGANFEICTCWEDRCNDH